MAQSPDVQVHLKDVTLEDHVRDAIERRCDTMAAEFHEIRRFEFTVSEDPGGFAVHGHARGKNTDVATHSVASEVGPASDAVLDKIEKQLRRNHDKRIFAQRREAQKDPPKRKPA